MARFANSVLFTPASGGTGDFVVSAAVTGYMTPALAGVATGVYKYRAESTDLTQWEIGEGTYTSGTVTLTRTTVLYNSSGTGTAAGQSGAGTKISFTVAPNVGLVQTVEDTIGVDQANSFTAAQKSQIRANQDVLKYNYIVNGAMMISQENGTTALTASSTYPVDQFVVGVSNSGTFSIAQVASPTPGGSPNRIRFTVTAADAAVAAGDIVQIAQNIEGLRIADLKFGAAGAKSVTIQFGVKAPAGTYCVAILNSAADRAYVAEYVISGGEANTDVVKSVTIPGDTSGTWLSDTGIGYRVFWAMMAGSTYQTTAGAWQAGNFRGTSSQFNIMGTNGNVFELFDVSLTEGTVAPTFQVPEFVSALNLCQRYYQKSFEYTTKPVQNLGSLVGSLVCVAASTASGSGSVSVIFQPPMRASPTITTYNTNAANANWRDSTASADRTVTVADVCDKSMRLVVTATTTAAAQHFIHWQATARL